MKKNLVCFIVFLMVSVYSAAEFKIIREPIFDFSPCIIYKVYEPNIIEPGEFFKSMDISFSAIQGNPSGGLWILDNVIEPISFDAARKQKLFDYGSFIGDIDINNVNKFNLSPLPNPPIEDPNIIWQDTVRTEVIKVGDIEFTETIPVYRSNMVVVNDFWGTGQEGFGLCFLDIVGIEDLVVTLHMNTGVSYKFMQDEDGLVLITDNPIIEIIMGYKGTSKVCHFDWCRYWVNGSMILLTLEEMVEQGKRPCKICGKDVVFPTEE